MFRRKPQKDVEEQVLPRVSITGALGKLRSEADFVQIDGNWREVKNLDEILQGLYLNLSRSSQQKKFKGCGVLLTGGADRQGLTSIVYPSEDKAGRLYPFVVFNRLADAGFYYKPEALFMSGMQSMKKALSEELNCGEVPEFNWLNRLSQLPERQAYSDLRSAKRNAMSIAEDVLLEEFLVSIAGHEQELKANFMTGVALLIKMLKENRVHRAYHGVWFPIPSYGKMENVIAFWLQLLSAVVPGNQWRPEIVWTSEIENSRLFVFTKPITSTGLMSTIDNEAATNGFLGWYDVLSSSDSSENTKKLILPWLNRKSASLLDVAIEWYQLL